MITFKEFLIEGYARGAGNAKSSKSHTLMMGENPIAAGKNFSDPTIDGLREKLLDIFWPKANGDKKLEVAINQCITTFVHAMDKKLRIDAEIIEKLANAVQMDAKKVADILSETMDKYYGSFTNIYGMS